MIDNTVATFFSDELSSVDPEVERLLRAESERQNDEEYEITAVVGFGESDNLAGATFAGVDLPTARRLFDLEGQYSSITIIAASSPPLMTKSPPLV